MAVEFHESQGGWVAEGGKYQMRHEGQRVGQRFALFVSGRREASFYASSSKHSDEHGPVYIWTLGVSAKTAEVVIGVESYATLYRAFFEAYQRSFKSLPHGRVMLAFDRDIEAKEWERWGP
ncbi:hypothetical protein [uncultured Sphingomonas sp.]|uniref:hypothetical protein n=1 Tax=uncultured Sphingomonas sp. TaxID=158754 RepID=UPI0025EDA1DB|nr:hypothetical protein [uncultured Sphingomonas sp.]